MTTSDQALAVALQRSDGGDRFRYIWFTVVAALLAIVVPLLLIAQVPDTGRSSAWILTFLVMILAGFRLSFAIGSGRPMLFDFFFYVFVYVFMGMAPTVQIRSNLPSTTTPGIDSSLDLPTAVIVCVGIVFYEIGRLIGRQRERGRGADSILLKRAVAPSAPPRSARAAGETSRTAAVSGLRAVILLVLGVGFSAYFVSKVGIGSLFQSREQASAVRAAVWPDPATRSVVYSLASYPILIGVGALSQVRRRAAGALAPWYGALILVAVAILVVVVNPISSARYSIGTVYFALIVFAGAILSPLRIRATMVATIAGLIFVFPLADAFRTPAVRVARTSFFGEYQSNPDYDAFWQIANGFSYWVDGLVQPLRQLSGSLLFWVPRAIYPDKPVDTGILLAQYRGYSFSNLSAPLWAEFLVNGGVVAVIIGFIVVGALFRTMDRRLQPAFREAGVWAIVGAVFPVYTTILLRGSLLQATGAVFVAVVCILFVRSWRPRSPRLTVGRPVRVVPRSHPSRTDREPQPRQPARVVAPASYPKGVDPPR